MSEQRMSDDYLRQHRRVPVDVEVSMVSDDNFYAGITDNISQGGVFVATYQPPQIGAEVDVRLRLPESDQTFICRGIVRWIRSFEASCDGAPPGCGIQWCLLSREALAAIQHFVSRRETILFEDAA